MRFKKIVLFLLGLLYSLHSVPLYAEIKPSALLLPIRFVDLNKVGLQKSLDNHVRSELALYYELNTEKEVKQAQEVAVDKISSDNCTEDACIKAMGDILDVEYIFTLEVINVGKDWDLNVTQTNPDGLRNPRNELCKNCDLSKARTMLSEMLLALRPGEVQTKRGKASFRIKSTPQAQVFLNGIKQGKTPLTLNVDAGKQLDIMLIANDEGYNDFTESFTLKPGEKRKREIILVRKRGRIRLDSTPSGARIFIDGKPAVDAKGRTKKTPADLRLIYGKHQFKLTLNGYANYTETLNVNQVDLGERNWRFLTNPGRLVVRVPLDHKNSTVLMDGEALGDMEGEFVKTFEIPSNVEHTIQARDGSFTSAVQTIQIRPNSSGKVELRNFTEQVAELPKEPENREQISDDSNRLKNNRLGFLLNMVSASLKTATKKIELSYTPIGFSFQHKMFKLEFATGEGIISNNGQGNFYFYDKGKFIQVNSTNITILRFIISPTYKARWLLTEFGQEQVTILLGTESGDNLKISLFQPIISLGYRKLWNSAYFHIKYGYSLVEKTAMSTSDNNSNWSADKKDQEIFDYSSGLAMGVGLTW